MSPSLLPQPLFCILDNLQLLENPTDVQQTLNLRQLIDILAPETAITASRPIRTSFTSNGHSVLLAALHRADRAFKLDYEDESGDVIGADRQELKTLEWQD